MAKVFSVIGWLLLCFIVGNCQFLCYCLNSEQGLAETSVPKPNSTKVNHKDKRRMVASRRIWLISLAKGSCFNMLVHGVTGRWKGNSRKHPGYKPIVSRCFCILCLYLCCLFEATKHLNSDVMGHRCQEERLGLWTCTKQETAGACWSTIAAISPH